MKFGNGAVRGSRLETPWRVLAVVMLCGCSSADRRDGRVSTTPVSDAGPEDGTLPGDAPDAAEPGVDGSTGYCDPLSEDSDADRDGDGFTPAQGDCNDCDAAANPGAFDFPGNGADEDCRDGDANADPYLCDQGLALDSDDPEDAARAIGLCQFTTEDSGQWGVLSAAFVRPDGMPGLDSPLQHGLLPRLGTRSPPKGSSMLALSSGIARAPSQPDYTSDCDSFGTTMFGVPVPPDPTPFPAGFPVESPSCPGVRSGPVYNGAALEVRIRVPTNAQSLNFLSNFHTYEYPNFICSEYNDFFVALQLPRPAGLVNDNVVFDTDGNLVSVNSSLLRVCEPGTHGGKSFPCPGGVGPLEGTGFDGTADCGTGAVFGAGSFGQAPRAATGWLRTSAPVEGGTILTLRFAIWDSGDGTLDSLALVDNFRWDVDEAEVVTVPELI